ncbi:uncharacterized protein LOC135958605 [Calliphora vicina]|uniref:uncharacterized protein LOC135958605 n=1 Tax=Calliphora vicina TaxID=7373 RepID=UPI00325BDB95
MSLDQFIRLADSIVEFEADLNDNRYPLTTHHALEVHRFELKSLWNRIRIAYEQFLAEAEKETNEGEDPIDIESFKQKYKSTYTTYCNCLTKVGQLSDDLRDQQVSSPEVVTRPTDLSAIRISSHDVIPNPIPSVSHSFHLPPVEIETFHGDYASWPTFRDMFTAIMSNSRASNVEKLFFLMQKTTGEAKEIVRKSPLTNQGFDLAWKNLCLRYENRRVLVNGQLKILFNLKPIHSESGTALKQLQRDINSCISILKLYNIDVASWDPIFVFICTNKLPENTLTLWEQQLSDKTEIPKWSELDQFLTNRYRTLESVTEIRGSSSTKSNDQKPKNMSSSISNKKVHSFQAKVSTPKCQLCPKETHTIRKCAKFLKMSYQQRLEEIKKEGLCLNCFSKTHSVRNCTSKHSCFKCQKRHNTLLHKDVDNSNSSQQGPSTSSSALKPTSAPYYPSNSGPIQSTNDSTSGRVQSCFASNSKCVLLGTAWVYILHLGTKYQVRALIDSGSEGTFISERLLNTIKLPSQPNNAQISGLNNTVSAKVQRQCSIVVGSNINSDISISVTALVVPHLSNNLPSQSFSHSKFSSLPDIQLADPKFYSSSKIDMLIGGDVFPLIVRSGIIHNVCESLLAQETVFGWILTGPVTRQSNTNLTIASHFCEITLDKAISRFWEVENLPKKNFMSPSDRACEELYFQTTSRNSDGRYIVSLPFKEGFPDSPSIGHSRSSAMAQFLRNEARLIRNADLKFEYDKVVREYEELGHMTKVSSSNLSDNSKVYYLPHHAVVKPDSLTTKVRVVFNASSPSSNGLSLNSVLHVGPILQNDLTLLILRWRFFKFVFNADIQKMYRQILVDPKHTSYQRILFRDSPNSPICDYELKTVTFGVNCAPYLAIRTLLRLADDVQDTLPIASSILRKSMYVDDVLAGAHSKRDAIIAKRELIQALHSAGFELRKWTSNSVDILTDIPKDHLLHEHFLIFEDNSSAKTLGIRWNAHSDEFYFDARQFEKSTVYTKREVLSRIAKLFDPAGWLAPCIVLAKMLMQRIWIDGTDWDENLSPETLHQWKSFEESYPSINSIRIPRWIDYVINADVQFHGFCDASEKAYAAALYIRISLNSSVQTHLISSKTKVAPIKTLSIPRLELCGALLLAEMIENLIPSLDVDNYTITCWTDSTIVLSWLAKPACNWLTFVANRVSKITQIVPFSRWKHIISEENPADLASRGISPSELNNNKLWWFGPSWLKNSISDWPNQHLFDTPNTDLEIKPIRVHFSFFSDFDDLLERFSSFSKAMRVMAYVYRFFYRTHPRFRSSFYKDSTLISSCEIISVRDRLISVCQKAAYPNDYRALSSRRVVSKSSSILNLNPFLDEEAGAPHMGGLWEAGVKSFKAHFRKTAGCHKYTHEELSTLLSKIESCLNSRPISPVSTDPTDLCALTPGHFLIGSPILAPIDPQVNDSSVSITNRWQKLKLVHQNFCQRWKNEYLKELHKRIKWQRPEQNLQEGSLVVIRDENLPPNSWRLGRVTKIYSGSDNRVRVAEVFTQRGIIKRPIVKLILLPTESELRPPS